MIKKLTGRATFESTGATIVVDFQPQTGITAVVGPNGSGKTFIASEASRYLMFGSSALRGKVTDFTFLGMEGDVVIRGIDYNIKRTLKSATMTRGDEVQAVGADAVTKKVIELLGYGLDVFDVCNSSIQGETALFGRLRPSERKAMVDQILNVVDVKTCEKACRDEASALRREAEAMTKTMRLPSDKPKTPSSGWTASTAQMLLNEGRSRVAQADALRAAIKPLYVPVKPSEPRPDATDVEAHERARIIDQAERDRVKSAVRPTNSVEDIVEGMKVYELVAEAHRRGPKPVESLPCVNTRLATWDKIDALNEIADQEVECPSCAHKFHTREPLPEAPKQTREWLLEERRRIERWSLPLATWDDNAHIINPDVGRGWIADHKAADEAEARLAQPMLADRSAELAAMKRLTAAHDAYEEQQAAYEVAREDNQSHEAALASLGTIPTSAELDALSDALREAQTYEHEYARWVLDVEALSSVTTQIDDLKTLADEYKAGSDGLADARATLKAYLAPALSRVATSLIFDMTNGKLASVVVDEDMEITVNGQRLETLSGAGATVANIALRIALGKVLVGKAFPVFIGDEMDGDLDVERRQATIQAMVSLKDHLSQIILITHRDVSVADQVIDLGDQS